MSVTLRFQRHGSKNRPFYDLVATDHKNSRDGKFIEKVGYYDPKHKPSLFKINEERVKHWYALGAEVSNTVRLLLHKNNFKLERAKTTPKSATPKAKKEKPAKTKKK